MEGLITSFSITVVLQLIEKPSGYYDLKTNEAIEIDKIMKKKLEMNIPVLTPAKQFLSPLCHNKCRPVTQFHGKSIIRSIWMDSENITNIIECDKRT
jgi:hypothetical protein